METSVHRRARIAGWATCAAMVATGVAGCQGSSETPTDPYAQTSGLTATTETRDEFHMTAPDGWVRTEDPYGRFADVLSHSDVDGQALLTVRRSSPENLKQVSGQSLSEPISVDIDAYRDWVMEDAESGAATSDTAALPDREIGDCEATGMTSVSEGGAALETWYVWRRDGLWIFHLSAPPASDTVSSELDEALDTVTWEPAGCGFTAATPPSGSPPPQDDAS